MTTTQFETILLDAVRGGVQSGNSPEQRRERHRNLCELPTPAEAERQPVCNEPRVPPGGGARAVPVVSCRNPAPRSCVSFVFRFGPFV
jgi:hypothetical protein